MSNKTFTEKEIKSISKNPYVKAVSRKAITYTNEFKRYFIAENEMGKLPREIFEESGFDIEIVGMDRVQGAVKDDVHPIRRMMKATQERRVMPNLSKRQFKQGVPGKVLLTDITYIFYGTGYKAYLSTIKDGSTNEILAYHVSDRITMDLAIDTLLKLKKNRR